ncbi:hypothetical protein CDAR_448961 [Caerostris darwini]|uniref:Uncharacterized protein n=1 Tax=Caerostris darwini TaxID=1538125 RepID=A0AAV4WCP4_9ARAC|nr:hypothetical protein CDAR_448961 [Caerostris darwini]
MCKGRSQKLVSLIVRNSSTDILSTPCQRFPLFVLLCPPPLSPGLRDGPICRDVPENSIGCRREGGGGRVLARVGRRGDDRLQQRTSAPSEGGASPPSRSWRA